MLRNSLIKHSMCLVLSLLLLLFLMSGVYYKTYWLTIPSVIIFLIFFPILLARRKETQTYISLRQVLKDKLLIITFVILLISYLILYYIVPFYIMPLVDEENRKSLHFLTSAILRDSKDDDIEKTQRIYEWMIDSNHLTNIYRDYKIDNYIVFLLRPPFMCLRLTGEKYPLWVLFSKCGACMEYSLLFREIANSANLTVSVHNPGEDHNWDEVLINGEWIIVDSSLPVFNPTPDFYEVKRNLNVSYVYGEYPNGTIVNLTERYTNTSLVKILVLDEDNKPIEFANIQFYSFNLNNQEREIKHLECFTDQNGSCNVRLGGGKYKIKVIKLDDFVGYFNEVSFELIEGETKGVTMVLKKDLMHITIHPFIQRIGMEILAPILGFTWLFFLYLLMRKVIVAINNLKHRSIKT